MLTTRRRVATVVAGGLLLSLVIGGPARADRGQVIAAASGSGEYALLGTTPAAFSFSSVAHENGGVGGDLHVATVF